MPAFGRISQSKSLLSLSLRSNAIDDEGLRHLLFFLQDCDRLTSLDLSGNHITHNCLPVVADFLGTAERVHLLVESALNMKEIDISGVLMTSQQAKPFRRLSTMSECNIVVSVDTRWLTR